MADRRTGELGRARELRLAASDCTGEIAEPAGEPVTGIHPRVEQAWTRPFPGREYVTGVEPDPGVEQRGRNLKNIGRTETGRGGSVILGGLFGPTDRRVEIRIQGTEERQKRFRKPVDRNVGSGQRGRRGFDPDLNESLRDQEREEVVRCSLRPTLDEDRVGSRLCGTDDGTVSGQSDRELRPGVPPQQFGDVVREPLRRVRGGSAG